MASAYHQHRFFQLFWKKAGKKIAILFAVLTIGAGIVFRFSGISWTAPIEEGINQSVNVELTLLQNAESKGAVCLDGSSPGYHIQKGFGSGAKNWLLHIEGGGWCNTVESCSQRKTTALGQSLHQYSSVTVNNFFPVQLLYYKYDVFFNWNRVKIRYCDGGSFSGDSESLDQDGSKLYFRGQKIWRELMKELLSKGLASAQKALLSGCSAGGLATFLHCDDFRLLLPKVKTVKCLSDGGFFLDEKDIAGRSTIQTFYREVVLLQGIAKSLYAGCTSTTEEPSQCFFPERIIPHIRTPVFVVNPTYDFWQIQNVLAPDDADPHHRWDKCKGSIYSCTSGQMKVLQGFRDKMLTALKHVLDSKSIGLFVNSCFAHCQTWFGSTWHSLESPKLNNKTIAEAVGDWYFEREEVKLFDCVFPCNPTCYNVSFL